MATGKHDIWVMSIPTARSPVNNVGRTFEVKWPENGTGNAHLARIALHGKGYSHNKEARRAFHWTHVNPNIETG